MLSGDQFFSTWIEQSGDEHIIIRTQGPVHLPLHNGDSVHS